MSTGGVSHDDCRNCRQRFEILLVKFKLAGVQMISACPNCAMIHDGSEASVRVRGSSKRERFLLLDFRLMPEAKPRVRR